MNQAAVAGKKAKSRKERSKQPSLAEVKEMVDGTALGLPADAQALLAGLEVNLATAPHTLLSRPEKENEEPKCHPALAKQFPWAKRFVIKPLHAHLPIAVRLLKDLEDIFAGEMEKIRFLRVLSQLGKLTAYITYVSNGNPQDPNVVSETPTPDGAYGSAILDAVRAAELGSTVVDLAAIDTAHILSQQDPPESEDADESSLVAVITKESLSALEDLATGADKEAAGRIKRLAGKIRSTCRCSLRSLAMVTGKEMVELMDPQRYPNFAEFFDFLRAQFALATLGGKPGALRLPPVLLLGDAGIGKTAVLSKLARVVDTGFLRLNLASSQNGATLSGSDIYWSNSRPGALFDMLVFGMTANPVIFLDELDKVAAHERNPVGSLYELLERGTAAEFCDLALPGVRIDASHVVWVASANNAMHIEPAILSRFKVFRIPAPTRAQMPVVLQSIYADLLASEPWGQLFARELPAAVIDALIDMSPRDARVAIENACGRAALEGRVSLLPGDAQTILARRTIGFTHVV